MFVDEFNSGYASRVCIIFYNTSSIGRIVLRDLTSNNKPHLKRSFLFFVPLNAPYPELNKNKITL